MKTLNQNEKNTDSLQKKKPFSFSLIFMIIVLFSVTLFMFQLRWNISEIDQEDSLDEWKRELSFSAEEIRKKNEKLFLQFKNTLSIAGDESFQVAVNNTESTVKKISSLKNSTFLLFLLVNDELKNQNSAQDELIRQLSPTIIAPCIKGNLSIKNHLEIFLHGLQENCNDFYSSCAADLQKSPPKNIAFSDRETLSRNLADFHEKTIAFSGNKMLVNIGTGIELLFLKETFQAVSRLMGKLTAKAAASAIAPVADGPLPVGDILSAAGFLWCGYDLFQVTEVLPAELQKSLENTILLCQKDARKNALKIAEDCLNSCNTGMDEVIRSL